jgi:hypothetical protein
MRYFILFFIMVVGFNAQANRYSELAISSTPASLFVNTNEAVTACQSVDESEQTPISSSTHTYEFALTETSRYSSAGRLLLNTPKPDYQVEIELSIPPSPSLVIGYAVNINFYQHWLTHISFSKSRLSGWKDSNLLYSHRQYPAVIRFI